MITYEQDPDFVRWGLQLFESDPYSNSNNYSYGDPQLDAASALGYYNNNAHFKQVASVDYNPEPPADNDDDELIARALQHELSHLVVSDTPDSSLHHADDAFQVDDVFQQGWVGESAVGGCFSSEQEDDQDEVRPPSSLCSSPQGDSYCEEDWLYSLNMMDEYASDKEVGKWLNDIVPIPHVPRTNGEIPSIDEATVDHQRLLDRLQVYDLVERKVQGDGNCQFRALSDQFYRTPEHHEFVRREVVNQLKSYPEKYEGYVPMAYGDYLEKMSKCGEWGDHVTLQAAADSYGVKIFVITSFKDTCCIEILPNVQRSVRVILLSFWAEVHYNSIFPQGDLPTVQTRRKKKWRMFRTKYLESMDDQPNI